MNDWTLTHNSLTQDFATLGLNKPKWRFSADGQDVCVLELPNHTLEDAIPYSHGDWLEIEHDGQRWFAGALVNYPRSGKAKSESARLEIRGPWYYLEQLAFQQLWQFANDPNDEESTLSPRLISRVILSQDLDGEKVDLATQLQEILDYAIAAGVPIQAGTLDLPLTVPWEEYADLTCAEAIEELLKWTPDAAIAFDYTTTPPTLNVRRRSQMSALSLSIPPADGSIAGPTIEALDILSRPDLQVSEVFMSYVFENRSNRKRWREIVTDVYPPSATGQSLGSLTKTLELRGSVYYSRRTVLKQEIESNVIDDIHTLSFWEDFFPELRSVDPSKITISNATREGNTNLDRILTKGAITDWMEDKHGHIAEKQRVFCRIGPFRRAIQGKEGEDVVYYDLETEITATNATSGTYRFSKTPSESYTPPEPAPIGLAEMLYNALSPLQWEGSLTLVEEALSGSLRPGYVLNLTDGPAEWASMRAVIQRVEEFPEEGRTLVTLGVAPSLSAKGLLALMRLDQNPRKRHGLSKRPSARIGGEDKDEDEDQGLSKYHPSTPGSVPGTPQHQKFVVQDPEADPNSYFRSMVIDTSDLPDQNTVTEDIICRLKEIPVAASDEFGEPVLRYASVVISDPYEKV